MKTKSIITGIGIAMAAGGAAAMLSESMASPSLKRAYKKKAVKAMKAVENVLDDVSDIFK